jgi:hypothetical protein
MKGLGMPRAGVAERDPADRVPLIRSPALIGRDQELAVLAQALASGPAVVLVEGEPGIGKSRLVQEYLASPAGRPRRILTAACAPFRQPFTLGPVVDALRHATEDVAGLRLSPLAGALRPLFPEWVGGLPPAPEPLIFLRYNASLDLGNAWTAPGSYPLQITAYHQEPNAPAITGLTLWTSTNGGARWKKAAVTSHGDDAYTTTITVLKLPITGGTVSIKVQARDAGGNDVTQVLYNTWNLVLAGG